MSTYSYDGDRRRTRGLEKVVWAIMGLMVTFVLLSSFHPAFKDYLKKAPGSFGVGLIIIYLMFLMFSRRVFRTQRVANVKLSTTRRNLTFNDLNGEKFYTWRDVREADLRVEVDGQGQAYVRRFVLHVPKAKVTLDNDPQVPLVNAGQLVEEIRERVSARTWRFHWYHPLCPLCGTTLAAAPPCPRCGENVRYVSKLTRPWEIVREESLYVFLLLVVMGGSEPLFIPVALAFACSLFVFAIARNPARRLKALEAASAQPRPGEAASGGALIALGLATLMLSSATAAPRPMSPNRYAQWWAEAARPSTSHPMIDSSYFPLAVHNTWEYRSNFDTVVMKVTRQENVNGISCFVLESFVGDGGESVQSECLTVGPKGVEVVKRTHKGTDFFLDTAEPVLPFPLTAGRHWTWQGNASQGNVMLTFEVKASRPINVVGRDVEAVQIVIHGRAADGAEIQTKRWYARGIGMVREQSMMKKAGTATTMDATLQNYSVRIGPASGPDS